MLLRHAAILLAVAGFCFLALGIYLVKSGVSMYLSGDERTSKKISKFKHKTTPTPIYYDYILLGAVLLLSSVGSFCGLVYRIWFNEKARLQRAIRKYWRERPQRVAEGFEEMRTFYLGLPPIPPEEHESYL